MFWDLHITTSPAQFLHALHNAVINLAYLVFFYEVEQKAFHDAH